MTQYEKILVAFDGSKKGLKALDSAKRLTEDHGAHLTVAYVNEEEHDHPIIGARNSAGEYFVYHSEDPNIIEPSGDPILEENLFDMVTNTAKVKLSAIPDVTYEKLQGNPSTEIVHYATTNDMDLIIVGNRGLGNLRKHLMGSVSQKVTDDAKCSVLVVK